MATIIGQATATAYTEIITANVVLEHEQEFMPYELTNYPTNLFTVMPNIGDRFVLSNGNYFEHYAPSENQPHGIIAWVVQGDNRVSAGGIGLIADVWVSRPEGYAAVGESYISDQNPFGTGFVYPASDQPEYTGRYAATGMVASLTQEFFEGSVTSDDPYDPGGTSTTGGGTGSFDGTGDAISFPSLPTLSAVATGFVSLYAPTLTQLNNLASYMWSGGFDIDTFRKLFADPMDVILGLSIVPVSVPVSGAQEVKVGNISTGISMNRASTQYVNVDCGTLQVKEFWGSCLDYSPNSKCQIFLPYIGTRSIDIDEIMGKTIHVKYAVDILSGALVANIMCGNSVLYSFTGACASSIPVVSRDFTSIISSAIQIAGNIGMAVATGGLSTPVSAASAVQLGVAAGQTAMNVANSKPSVQHSGAVGGTSGMLSVQTPYLIFELPRQSLPSGYNKFGGYPANITLNLGSCMGYTKVEMIHLENIPATDTELREIETLLKSGVIL